MISEIKEELKKLDFLKQITFVYLASERSFPIYVFFSETYNFGNPTIMRDSINYVYQAIFNIDRIDNSKIENLLTQIFDNSVNTTDFGTSDAQIAMYSCGVIYESVNLLKGNDIHRILSDIVTMSRDIIDCFIQERDDLDYGDPGFEEKIANDPLMQAEIQLQKGIIAYLHKIARVDSSDVETLLELQNNTLKPVWNTLSR